jgi:hypothetical protein
LKGAPDDELTADSEGRFSGGRGVTCAPATFLVTTDPALSDTAPTVTFGAVGPPGVPIEHTLGSISASTASIIPALLGVELDPARGVIAGVVRDCAGAPIEGAQLIASDYATGYSRSQVTRYFTEEFPSRDQPYTSGDGLFLTMELDPGYYTLEVFGIVEGVDEPLLIAHAGIDVIGGAFHRVELTVNIAGPNLPEACLESCE